MGKPTDNIEDKVLKFGNTQIRRSAIEGMTEKEFLKTYKPLISTGAEQAVKELKKKKIYFKK